MKNDKIIHSWDKLNPSNEAKNRIFNNVMERGQRKRPAFATAMAAVICLAVLGGLFLSPQDTNIFILKAYALEEQADGIGVQEIDLLNQPDVWGGHYDGKYFYVSVGLQYEGENIKSVEFAMEGGAFARQYISDFKDGENVSRMYVGADNQLVMVGEEFEILGAEISLDDETVTDDMLLFCALEIPDVNSKPDKIEITATATFNDGKTQEQTVVIDLSGTGVYTSMMSSEDVDAAMKSHDYYMNIPLEQCELIPEYTQTITGDYFEIYVNGEFVSSFLVDLEHREFDENGISRGGCGNLGLEGMNIVVYQRGENGELTGMIYRVPKSLIYAD